MIESKNEAEDLHIKLGHLGITNMKELLLLVDGLNITEQEVDKLNQPCEICVEANQTKFPFQTERLRAGRPLPIIHCDICGPIKSKIRDGKRYILSLLDDITHFTMIHLLETKNGRVH
ncbi:hypothetical protein JTB14_000865 [Gonioctena quinquepunctata]|nr:hypothetical protein JTB14_000865 [Gonioctena quinquepunctata]